MKNFTRHTGTLVILERLNNSTYGNPNYRIKVDGVVCRTKNDSAYNYDIENLVGNRVIIEVGTHYNKATLNSIREYAIEE